MTAPGYIPPPLKSWWVKSNRVLFPVPAALALTGGVPPINIGTTVFVSAGATLTLTGSTPNANVGNTAFVSGASLALTGGIPRLALALRPSGASLTLTGGTPVVGSQYGDFFNRANSTASLGAGWTNRLNVMGINGNSAYPVTVGGFSYATFDQTMVFDDMKVSIVLGTHSSSGIENSEIILAVNTTGECVSFTWDVNIGGFALRSKTSWADTGTARDTAGATTVTTGDVLTLRRTGNFYEGQKNGSTVCSWTDSGNVVPRDSTHRLVGMGGFNNGNYRRIDSWSAENI